MKSKTAMLKKLRVCVLVVGDRKTFSLHPSTAFIFVVTIKISSERPAHCIIDRCFFQLLSALTLSTNKPALFTHWFTFQYTGKMRNFFGLP